MPETSTPAGSSPTADKRSLRARSAGAAGVPLLERGAEQHTLAGILNAAMRGPGRVVLVEGDEGIGKTRLLRSVRAYASRTGLGTAVVHADRVEVDDPFAVARRLVEALLVGEQAAAGAVVRGTLPEGMEGTGPETGDRLLRAVVRLAARRPLLLALDDAHWMDPESAQWLGRLAHRVATLPVVAVVARRAHVVSEGQDELDELLRHADAIVLRLQPLGVPGASGMVEHLLESPSDELAARAHDATSGNPLLLTRLLEAVRDDGRPLAQLTDDLPSVLPRSLLRWGHRKLTELSEDARQLATAASLLDEPPGLELAGRLVGLPIAAADEAAAELGRLGLLRSANPLRLDPPVLNWAIRADLDLGRRRELHAAATRALADEDRAREAAEHLLAVPPAGSAWATERLRAGAKAASALGDHEGAARLLRRALDEPPPAGQRAVLSYELGATLALQRPREALAPLEEAAFESPDPRLSARATLLLADVQQLMGSAGEALLRLKALAATQADELADERRQAQALCLLDDEVPDPTPRKDLSGRGDRLLLLRRAEHGIEHGTPAADVLRDVERALSRGVLADDPLAGDLHLVQALSLLTACGRTDLALVHAGDGLLDPRTSGAGLLHAALRLVRAHAHLHRDRVVDAALDADAALGYVVEHAPALAGIAAELAVRARLGQGQIDDARAALAQTTSVIGDLPLSRGRWKLARARVALADGDLRHGVAALLEARHDLGGPARNESVLPVLADAVDALIAINELGAARELAAELKRRQLPFAEPRGYGRALRAEAALCKDRDRQESLLAQSAARLAQAHAPIERAIVLLRLAAMCEQDGDRTTVRRLLREAVEETAVVGAVALHAEASTLLVAAGGRPRPVAGRALETLTPAERKVVELAAAGGSNRDIAGDLSLAVKTVEMHLSRSYRKLGITSRRQLTTVLSPAGTAQI